MPSSRTAHESRRAGATAAEAVDLSDDDDDVVIIEENMQPEPQGPKGLKASAVVKQPGGSAAPAVYFTVFVISILPALTLVMA